MLTRFIAAGAACWLGLAPPAFAIPYIPPPQPVYEAPIDRALANVTADADLEPAQRERLMGRLNLLAYARGDGAFAYRRDTDQLNEAGAVRCLDAPRNMRVRSDEPGPKFEPQDLCANFDFYLGPQIELPSHVDSPPTPAALTRLRAARDHYQRALELGGADLRALLGLAYALDRLGAQRDARRTLRTLIEAGLPKLAEPQSNWEDHAVLTEAAEHLSHLAKSVGDISRVSRLRERLGASRPIVYVTPVLVPLADAPFARLIAPASPVAFDFAGTGDARAQGWLTPDAAWLVWDPHGRGDIRSGFDLIGAVTWAVFWSDGFEALRALDDDRSGELSGAELGGLALWRDADADGVSDPGEVAPLADYGVVALAVRGEPRAPGLIAADLGVRFADGTARPLYDWTPGLDAGAPRIAENRARQLAFSAAAP